MKKFLQGFSSFRVKVTAAMVGSLLLVMGLSNLLVTRFSLESQFEQLRQQLIVIAQTATVAVDAEALMRVPLNRGGVSTPDYQAAAVQLRRIRDLNPSVKFIYTLRKTDNPNLWQFVVDLDPEPTTRRIGEASAYPGDAYDVSRFAEMSHAFDGPSADREILADEWGITLSGYAPIRTADGTAVAVLGVDMDARDVYLAQRKIRRDSRQVMYAGILLSILIGVWLSGRMTRRIRRLTEGTRRLGGGDLKYRVPVEGKDEIGELSASFNQMSGALEESRDRLEKYFFGVVQSLIRMLEAKDRYTQGHSERVGYYAQQTALRMGFSQEEADVLLQAGELHDIGKLAVHDHILNKQGALTDEEWEIIRKHPVTGAEALKPVCFNEIIMTCVRHHHERPDGTGYPNKLKGNEINVFAQIIAIADAYDAMTTNRPYRKSMDKRSALEEIKKHAGTQFDARVAEAFLRLMEEPAK